MSPTITSGFIPASSTASAPPSTATISGLHVADVGPQRLQVAAVVLTADDDQHVTVAEPGAGRRKLDAAGEQIRLLAHVGDGVLGELGERLVDPLALLVELQLQLLDREHAAAQDLSPPDGDDAAGDAHPIALAKQLEGIGGVGVDQHHPGAGKQQRARVRVAAVGRR